MQNDDLKHLLEQMSLVESLQGHADAGKIPVVGKSTGYFLGFMVRLARPGNILEIGCGNGFSSYFIVKNMPGGSSYTGIDLNRQRLEDARDLIGSHFPDSDCCFICGNALQVVPELSLTFDLVFIDAAKFEYPGYLEAVKGKIKKGSLIIADDIFCKKKIFLKNVPTHYKNSVRGLRKYLESTGPGTGFNTEMLDVDGGLAVSIYGKDWSLG
jgi:predicted O-methyltransferase YrrM